MLYLHASNRTENLLLHLVEVLRAGGRRNLFEKEIFLIQSQGMERIISQTLADHFSSWCNFEFLLPMKFLHRCAEKLGMEPTPDGYERRIMTWRIEELLRDLSGDEYRLLRRYLTGSDQELKRYQLSVQLAHVFDQYQVMRPDMLAAWERGRQYVDDPSEPWQMALWKRLSVQSDSGVHRGILLEKVVKSLHASDVRDSRLPPRISVFGMSIMPPLFLDFLQGVSRHSDVHLYVLSPCENYWGDLEGRRQQLATSMDSPGSLTLLEESPEAHPLLTSLGQQGRDFQRMLFDDIAFEVEFTSYENPLLEAEPSLLRQVQADLMQGEVKGLEGERFADDSAIRIVSCHSKMREIGVLKEHILNWLYEDPDLQLRDIVVMAPDIQEYSSLIPAVFSDVQHSISDRSLRRRNSVIAVFSDFLTLLRGRFGWDEVLDLVRESVVAEKLQLSSADLENLRRWVVESGIRWGLSGHYREELDLPGYAESTWEAGLARLLMGYAIDSDSFVDGVLPYGDIEGSSGSALGGLCQFVSIMEKARAEFEKEHSLREWADLLKSFSLHLFENEGENSRDFMELQELLMDLGESAGSCHSGGVTFEVIDAWLDSVTREVRSSSGFLRGQLTFCSMLPMRSIPFRKVCLIGLNEGTFPQNDRYATFDLMAREHRPGDRSRRMDDRYQFLEALMAARDQLYISYIGQSVKTNEKVPPSVVVDELLDLLTGYYGVESPVVQHPLQPFSALYFSQEDRNVFSYDGSCCEVAERLQSPPVQAGSWWRGEREASIEQVSWQDCLQFYRNPQKWFVRHCLDIRLDREREKVPESETFLPGSLENYQLDHYLLEKIIAGENTGEVREHLLADGRWPLATPGALAFDEKIRTLEKFAALLADTGVGERAADIDFEFDDMARPLKGTLANVYEGGVLLFRYGRMKGADLLTAWLHHLVYGRIASAPVTTHLLCEGDGVTFSGHHQAGPALETLVEIFLEGSRQPSSLYVEPAYAWAKKARKGDGMKAAALANLRESLDRGYDPETSLLLSGCEPESVLGEAFEKMCRAVMLPIVEGGV